MGWTFLLEYALDVFCVILIGTVAAVALDAIGFGCEKPGRHTRWRE